MTQPAPAAAPEAAAAPPPGSRRFARARAFALGAGFAVGLAYFYQAALGTWFFHDDFIFLERSAVTSPADAVSLFSLERNQRGLDESSHAYRPLSTNVYFASVQHVFGMDARAFHAANLLSLAALATATALLLLGLGVGPPAAVASAALFALASFNFETQLWISVFQELSFALLTLTAVALHVRTVPPSRGTTAAVVALFVAALLCKEMAITLPAILFCWQLVVARAGVGAALARTRMLFLTAAVYLALRMSSMPLVDHGPYAVGVGAFLFESAWTYLSWTLEGFGANLPWVAFGFWPATLAVGCALASREARRLALFGALWFAIALAPVIILPDHVYRYYLVFPAIGFAIAAAVALDALARRIPSPPLRVAAAALLILAFAVATRPGFERAQARRAQQTERGAAILRQLMQQHPTLPDHTRVYFGVPGNFALERFLKGDGAVLRAAYRNPTLQAGRLAPGARAARCRDARSLCFVFGDDGVLRELPRGG